jgi:site-specific DNA-cytosine methylase
MMTRNLLTAPIRTTAYGGKSEVPGQPDILVAGFSCVDFSNLNNQKKNLEDKGESGQTFTGILEYIKLHRPPLIILENVKGAPWQQIEEHFRNICYHFMVKKVDTKHFYLPQTRERGYAICVDMTRVESNLAHQMLVDWNMIFGSLGRHASAPFSRFILDDDHPILEQVSREMALRINNGRSSTVIVWDRYRMRHDRLRAQLKLGEGRPLTHFSDNGACTMPAFAHREWTKQQPERVWDTLDINFLRSLRKFDMNYKQ